jgi:hypothetical protein
VKLFESLKRLLEPRPRAPVETIGEATADRPPPPVVEFSEEPATPEVVAAAHDASDVSEIRELLEDVAEAPEPAPTPLFEPPPVFEDASVFEPAPAAPPISTQGAAVAAAPVAHIGDALILALANPAATFTVAKTTVTIGRGEENKIRLDDLSVSRRHARIAWKQGGYWLSDLGSMGGTWVDGTRLNAPHRIAVGELIDIGLCRLTVDSAGGAAEAETKKSAGQPRSELAESRRRR